MSYNPALLERQAKRRIIKKLFQSGHTVYDAAAVTESPQSENLRAVPPIPFSVKFPNFSAGDDVFCLCDESGALKIYKNGATREISVHENSVFDLKWFDRDRKIITASADHTLRAVDLSTEKYISTFRGHFGTVRSVSASEASDSVFASSGRDGNINLWDLRTAKTARSQPVASILFAHNKKCRGRINKRPLFNRSADRPFDDISAYAQSRRFEFNHHCVSSVNFVFNRNDVLVSTGFVDGKIKMWDLRVLGQSKKSMALATSGDFKTPLISSSMARSGDLLSVSCYNGQCAVVDVIQFSNAHFDANERNWVVALLAGAQGGSAFIQSAFSPCGEYVAAGSSDGMLCVWDIKTKELNRIKAHEREVSGIDWNPEDFGKLLTCSDDKTVKLWNSNNLTP